MTNPPAESTDLPAWADRVAARIRVLSRRTVRDVLEIGRLIHTTRAQKDRGRLTEPQWAAWVGTLDLGRTSRWKYERVWELFRECSPCEHFELQALYLLAEASVPAAARAAAKGAAGRGELVTWERAVALVREHRPPDDPSTPRRFGAVAPDEATRQAAEVIRGAQVDALESAYANGRLGEVLWRDSPSEDLREKGEEIFHEIQLTLFPEHFQKPTAPESLCPPAGPRRAGAERVKLFAAKILAARTA